VSAPISLQISSLPPISFGAFPHAWQAAVSFTLLLKTTGLSVAENGFECTDATLTKRAAIARLLLPIHLHRVGANWGAGVLPTQKAHDRQARQSVE
jgi:hypothetical protein